MTGDGVICVTVTGVLEHEDVSFIREKSGVRYDIVPVDLLSPCLPAASYLSSSEDDGD